MTTDMVIVAASRTVVGKFGDTLGSAHETEIYAL
jgi:hypothetical protein